MSILENLKFHKNKIYIFFLTLFSIFINQYFGYIGILPIDSFLIFNSGYDFLKGASPFKDVWTIKEPFIDFLQAIFFKIFGISWFSYVFHASIFNFLISVFTYITLKYFDLSSELSLFYSTCVAILTYPTAGTPFSDHHTLILIFLCLYMFFFTLKSNNNILWFCIPILLGLSFFSKQTPTAYVSLMIGFFALIVLIKNREFRSLFVSFAGLIFFITIFFLYLFVFEIDFNDFLIQYILFPKSLGETRLDWVFPLEFKRVVLRFKIHYLAISILIFLSIKSTLSKKLSIRFEDKVIILSLILTCIFFIFHQLMTINAIFIYCLIPIFCGFSHVYFNKYLKNKNIHYFLILLSFVSTLYYFINYVQNRMFMDLNQTDLTKAIDGKLIHNKLDGVKWITMFYPDDPSSEVKNIKFAMKILKNDKDKKMLITDYQFISVFLNIPDYSTTRFWYNFHGYPDPKNEYFDYWKNFNLKNFKKNKIKNIYVLKPLHGEDKPLENIFGDCLVKEKFSPIFYKLNLKNCKQINKP